MADSDHDQWVQNIFGSDPASYPAAKTAIAAEPTGGGPPAPDPSLWEALEEGVESGVRTIGKVAETAVETVEEAAPAVEAVGEAVALASVAVAVGVGAAILTWSSSTAPPWMDEMNPETGKPYASAEEYEAVKKRRRERQAHPDQPPFAVPEAPPDDPDYKPPSPTCQNTFPGISICGFPPRGYESMDEAARAQPEFGRSTRSNVSTMDEYGSLPGGDKSHATYYDGSGTKLFTIIKTPCCQDTDAGPVLNWRWVPA
jgi:hypothetical protein